jgi:serine/threonine-protein kinase
MAELREVAEKARAMRGMDNRRSLGSRYRIRKRLGDGATGTVFLAEDTLLEMPVAVKVLNPGVSRVKAAVDTLRREARITIQLSHRHVVRLHTLDKAGSAYFLVMEFVDGENVRQVLQRAGPFNPHAAATIVEVCAEALNYAHRHGVLHNDLKPDNLMLSRDGILKVIDFGIACLINRQWNDQFIMGTPCYMSPEQARGDELDQRTDIYALGVISFELLTGSAPFPPNVTVEQVASRGELDLSAVPEPLRGAIRKATAINRNDRHSSVLDFASDFRSAVNEVWPRDSRSAK